jgi:hypothetical protein
VSVVTSDGVSDRLALSDLLDSYARGVDDKDFSFVTSLFTPDAALDYTAFGGPRGGPSEVFEWIAKAMKAFPMTQHHISNRVFEIDGGKATGRADLLAVMGMGAGDGKLNMMFTGGIYRDTFTRTPGGWKIAGRVCDKGWLAASGPEASGPEGPK